MQLEDYLRENKNYVLFLNNAQWIFSPLTFFFFNSLTWLLQCPTAGSSLAKQHFHNAL